MGANNHRQRKGKGGGGEKGKEGRGTEWPLRGVHPKTETQVGKMSGNGEERRKERGAKRDWNDEREWGKEERRKERE